MLTNREHIIILLFFLRWGGGGGGRGDPICVDKYFELVDVSMVFECGTSTACTSYNNMLPHQRKSQYIFEVLGDNLH